MRNRIEPKLRCRPRTASEGRPRTRALIAIIRDGKIVETKALGVRDASTAIPVDDNTIFEAASLSKPVFAYAVLQLVDAGVLSLDTPLSKYVPDYVKDDPRAASITVRHVLSQASGLPNWRSKANPLKTYFQPGERFSYSGEGFLWLQQVVEAVTAESFNSVMARLVFDPPGNEAVQLCLAGRF